MSGEESEFVSTFSDISRVGPPDPFGILSTVVSGGEGEMAEKLANLNKRTQRLNLSPEDKFKLTLTLFFNDKYEDLGLTRETLFGLAPIVNNKIPNLKYKNPHAFLLGYTVLRNKAIDKNIFNRIVKDIVPSVPEVTSPDIIRYAILVSKYL